MELKSWGLQTRAWRWTLFGASPREKKQDRLRLFRESGSDHTNTCIFSLLIFNTRGKKSSYSMDFRLDGCSVSLAHVRTDDRPENLRISKKNRIWRPSNKGRNTGWPRSYRKYILQITQPSQYGYAKLQYRFAVTSLSPSTSSQFQWRPYGAKLPAIDVVLKYLVLIEV